MWESSYRHLCLRGLGRFWTSSHLDGSAERRVGLDLAMEGACWGGLTCCMRYWGVLSQALALASVSVAVETLASSCSPEKNAAQSQQLFLPGRHCQGHLRWSCSLVFSSLEAAGSVSMCSPGHSECPWLWLLAATHCPGALPGRAGEGLNMVALRVFGMLRSKAGHCQPQEGRLCCASGLEAVAGPWLLLGEEAKFGPSSPSMAAGPARLVSCRLSLALKGLAGLPELLANL